ncbi:MAG: WD40/YVTN/BNR-like repeat-containing protein [Treponema sp.]
MGKKRLKITRCSTRRAYGKNIWVAVGVNFFSDRGEIITSRDNGNTWTKQASPTDMGLSGIAYGNDKWVAVGGEGTIITSPDGNTWTKQASPTDKRLSDIATNGIIFVAVGASGTVLSSADTVQWQ